MLLVVACASGAVAADGDFSATTLTARVHRGMPRKVVVQPPLAYVAIDSGFEIWNISALASPSLLSHLYLPGPAFDLEVVGTVAYVADGEAGLQVIDVADPSNPAWLASLKPPPASGMSARGVAVSGGLAYLAESGATGNLRVVDVTSPAAPVQIGEVGIDNGAVDVVVAGTTAWLALGYSLGGRHGLVSVDVSAPAMPVEVGYLDTGLPVNEIALQGSTAYLAVGRPSAGSLTIADISLPGAPLALGSLVTADGVVGVSIQGTVAYVALRALGLHAYDVSVPAAPSCLGSTDFGVEVHAVGTAPGIVVGGLRASNGAGGVVTVDSALPAALVQRAWMAQAEATGVAAASGAIAYELRRDGLAIFDVSVPAAPVLLSEWSLPGGDYTSMSQSGNRVAVAEGRRVHVLDVTDPAAPVEIAEHSVTTGVAVRPVLSGTELYVITGTGLETFTLGLVGGGSAALFPTAGWATDLAVDGSRGYLVAGDTMYVLDLTTPSTPSALGLYTIPGERLTGVDASGTLAVLTGLAAQLYTIDVTDPALPVGLASLTGMRGTDIALAGDRALIAAGGDGLRIVDVSTPAAPVEEAFYDTSGVASAVASYGNDVYLATMEGQHWSFSCTTCNVCIDSWPSILANSLRAVATAGGTFSWTIASGTGSSNLHRCTDKAVLPTLYGDMATLRVTTPGVSELDPDVPAPIFYYRVFGAGSCTGNSYYP